MSCDQIGGASISKLSPSCHPAYSKQHIENLFPKDNTNNDNIYDKNLRKFCQKTDNKSDDIQFTVQEITDVINKQNPRKAPGADGITSDIIQQINRIDDKLFTKIYNKCLKFQTFPELWKHSIVKVIPKNGKMDYTIADSYRPISLLPVMGKVYEKLLIQRVIEYFNKHKKLNSRQFGFTSQVSTEDALHSFTDFIKNTFEKKGMALVISLDISGAFNHCWCPKV